MRGRRGTVPVRADRHDGHLNVRGLMTMAAHTDDESEIRRCFTRCAELFEDMRKKGIGEGKFNILSMGMSGDFETAIECGANMVRVGSAFFGNRPSAGDDQGEG